MQIGDRVWIFNSNRRRYEDDKGNKLDSCWYKGHFEERYIVGETKQSWVIGYENTSPDDRSCLKVNKKTLRYTGSYGLDGKLYITEEMVDQECWIHDNHYDITEKIRWCKDYNKLKKILEVLQSE